MNIDIPLPEDLTTLTVEQATDAMAAIEKAQRDLIAVLDALRVVATTPTRIAETAGQWLDVRDGPAPDPAAATVEDYPTYVAPTGAHDAYPGGRIICVDGQLWQARRNGVAHSPEDAPEEWEEVFLVDGEITTTRPVDPDTGIPDYPVYDSSKTYFQNTHNTPLVIVKHNGTLYELIHSAAAPGYTPGAAGMHDVWRVFTP